MFGSCVVGRCCARGAPLCVEGAKERGRRRWPRGKWWSKGPPGLGPRAMPGLKGLLGANPFAPSMSELVGRRL